MLRGGSVGSPPRPACACSALTGRHRPKRHRPSARPTSAPHRIARRLASALQLGRCAGAGASPRVTRAGESAASSPHDGGFKPGRKRLITSIGPTSAIQSCIAMASDGNQVPAWTGQPFAHLMHKPAPPAAGAMPCIVPDSSIAMHTLPSQPPCFRAACLIRRSEEASTCVQATALCLAPTERLQQQLQLYRLRPRFVRAALLAIPAVVAWHGHC